MAALDASTRVHIMCVETQPTRANLLDIAGLARDKDLAPNDKRTRQGHSKVNLKLRRIARMPSLCRHSKCYPIELTPAQGSSGTSFRPHSPSAVTTEPHAFVEGLHAPKGKGPRRKQWSILYPAPSWQRDETLATR